MFAVLYSPVEAVHIRSDPARLRMKTSKSFTVIRPLPLPSGNGEPLLRPAERLRSVSAHEKADGFCSPTGRYSSEDRAGRHAGDREALDGAAADRDRGDARCRLAAGEGGLGDFPEQRNWTRLIRKTYEVDLLVCPKCNWQMPITGLPGAKLLLRHGLA